MLVRSGEELIDVLQQGQGVLNVLALAGVKDEIDARIHGAASVGGLSTISDPGAAGADVGASAAPRGLRLGGLSRFAGRSCRPADSFP